MEQTNLIPAFQKAVIVHAEPDRAFEVFTGQMVQWWPQSHHLGASPMIALVVEPREGGRWYEKDEDGSERDWGTVLACHPPRKVIFSWHLNGDLEYNSDLAQASEVEIQFLSEEAGRTKVVLGHRSFERHGATGNKLRDKVADPGGWPFVLEGYRKLVNQAIG